MCLRKRKPPAQPSKRAIASTPTDSAGGANFRQQIEKSAPAVSAIGNDPPSKIDKAPDRPSSKQNEALSLVPKEKTTMKSVTCQSQVPPKEKTAEGTVESKMKKTTNQSKVTKRSTASKRKRTEAKAAGGEESEHFEQGDEKSREDPSVDDTLKGVGTEMPHFES